MTKFKELQKSIGCESPLLNDVLKWHSSKGRDKYSHFEVSEGEAYFSIYDGEETDSIIWNLNFVALENQSEELIEWLSELIFEPRNESEIKIDMSDFKGSYSISEAKEVAKKMSERIEQVKLKHLKYKENKFDSWFEDFEREFKKEFSDYKDLKIDKSIVKSNCYDRGLSIEYSVELYLKEIKTAKK